MQRLHALGYVFWYTEYPVSCASSRQPAATWTSAKATCEGMGMQLPIIDTEAAKILIHNKV